MAIGTARHDVISRQLTLEGVQVQVTSYRIGERHSCTVDNIDPGAVIGRGSGPDRGSAEEAAINQASMKLCLSQASQSLNRSIQSLRPTAASSSSGEFKALRNK